MKRIRTNRKFNQASDLEVSKQGGKNISGFTANLDLEDPPETPAVLTTLKDAFDEWIVKAANKGTWENAQKDAAREALLDALNKDASYVDIKCNGSLPILLSSGFEAVSDNRVRVILDPPIIKNAVHVQEGEIKLILKGDRNRKIVQGRIKPVGGEWGPLITFKSTRDIMFGGLTAGTTYVMQLCALGGATGMSDWSAEVSKMAI